MNKFILPFGLMCILASGAFAQNLKPVVTKAGKSVAKTAAKQTKNTAVQCFKLAPEGEDPLLKKIKELDAIARLNAVKNQQITLQGVAFQKPKKELQKSIAQYRQWLERQTLTEPKIGVILSKAQVKKWQEQSWAQLRKLQQRMPAKDRQKVKAILQERQSVYLQPPARLAGVIAFSEESKAYMTTQIFRQWADEMTWAKQYWDVAPSSQSISQQARLLGQPADFMSTVSYDVPASYRKNLNFEVAGGFSLTEQATVLAPRLAQMTNEEFALMFALRYRLNELDLKAAKTFYGILLQNESYPSQQALQNYQRILGRVSHEAALCIEDIVSIMLKYPDVYKTDLQKLKALLAAQPIKTSFTEQLSRKL